MNEDDEERRKFEQRSLKKPKKPEPIFDNNIEIAQAKKLSKKDREQDWNEMATEETIPYPHNNYKDFSSYSEKTSSDSSDSSDQIPSEDLI